MNLLDTNVLSEWLKASPDPPVIAWLDRQRPAPLYLSAVVVAEIETGITLLPDGRNRDQLQLAAGAVLAAPLRLCPPMSVEDARTAAVVRAKGLHLATRSGADFDYLEDLFLIDPWQSP